jgi:hypothetical protein
VRAERRQQGLVAERDAAQAATAEAEAQAARITRERDDTLRQLAAEVNVEMPTKKATPKEAPSSEEDSGPQGQVRPKPQRPPRPRRSKRRPGHGRDRAGAGGSVCPATLPSEEVGRLRA